MERSGNRQAGGSGLGLSITRHIVEPHAGTVTAESIPRKGTTFAVSLPDRPPGD